MKLARYNEFIVAIAGTGIVIGLLVIAWHALDLGSRPRREPGVVVKPTKADKPAPAQNLVFCPTLTDPTGAFQYVPVAVVVASDAERDPVIGMYAKDKGYSSGDGCGAVRYGGASRTFNVVIRDMASGEQRLLLDRPGQIMRIELPDQKCSTGEGGTPCGTILWHVRMDDTNRDGTINADDALVAYVSGLDGKKLVQLTPRDATVLNSQWVAKREKWQFQVRRDVNKDGRFTEEDGSVLLETSSRTPSEAQPFIHESILKTLNAAAK